MNLLGQEPFDGRGDGADARADVERLFFERLRLELVLDMVAQASAPSPRSAGAGRRLGPPRPEANLLLPVGRPEAIAVSDQPRRRHAAWARDRERELRPLAPVPGHAARSAAVFRSIGFLLIALAPEPLAEIVRSVVPMQRKRRPFAPVFITDAADLEIFDAYGFVVEKLHDRAQHAVLGVGERWEDYARRRLDLLRRKWGLGEIIPFGAGVALLADEKV